MTGVRESLYVKHRPLHPILLWDGDCAFCAKWIRRWQKLTGPRITYCPYQEMRNRFPEIPVYSLKKAVHLVQVNGRVLQGAGAALHCFQQVRILCLLPWLYRRFPPFAWMTDKLYAFVARYRSRLP